MTLVNAYGRRRAGADPLLHASPSPPNPSSRVGGTYIAVCGAHVRNVTTALWESGGIGRRCPKCKNRLASDPPAEGTGAST